MECRPGCGACCVALSINSPLPGMPRGKPAGVTCVNLDEESRQCRIWGTDAYPPLCRAFIPGRDVCGDNREQAIALIDQLERQTR